MRYVVCVDIHQFHVQLQPPPCTLLLQVRLMWPTPRSLPKLLFFLVRYYVLVNAVFALACESHPTCCSILPQETRVDGLPTNMSPEQCKSAFYRVGSKSIRFLSRPCLRSAHCAYYPIWVSSFSAIVCVSRIGLSLATSVHSFIQVCRYGIRRFVFVPTLLQPYHCSRTRSHHRFRTLDHG
jgi:hypothetical protein